MNHVPVLLKEVIEILDPRPGEFVIDGTIGSGGHATEILKRISPNGILLGVDWDKDNIKKLIEIKKLRNWENVILTHANYANLPGILKKKKLGRADGLLLDLGFSSEQIESAGRGFSFMKDELLDMRYDRAEGMTAADVINRFREEDLAEIFWKYGEERYSRKIAAKVVEERRKNKIERTTQLAELIKKSVPKNYERCRLHPATRVFQALRIFVNQELENLETLLRNIEKIVKGRTRLRPAYTEASAGKQGFGGRVVIISFHSLEDRLVKNYFRELRNQRRAVILTKKPIRPSSEEIARNPRSRSAKLRAVGLL